MIVSFAWTTDAFMADRKSRTRREWNECHARQVIPGKTLIQAYDKIPIAGGKQIGLAITVVIKYEDVSLMPEEDYEKEGFAYMEEKGLKIWGKEPRQAFDEWREAGGMYWVLDFEKMPWP